MTVHVGLCMMIRLGSVRLFTCVVVVLVLVVMAVVRVIILYAPRDGEVRRSVGIGTGIQTTLCCDASASGCARVCRLDVGNSRLERVHVRHLQCRGRMSRLHRWCAVACQSCLPDTVASKDQGAGCRRRPWCAYSLRRHRRRSGSRICGRGDVRRAFVLGCSGCVLKVIFRPVLGTRHCQRKKRLDLVIVPKHPAFCEGMLRVASRGALLTCAMLRRAAVVCTRQCADLALTLGRADVTVRAWSAAAILAAVQATTRQVATSRWRRGNGVGY